MIHDLKYVPSTRRAYHYRAVKACLHTDRCATCGCIDQVLQIHHKDEDYTNNETDNLVCLCVPCHAAVHGDLAGFILSNPGK